MLVYPVLVVGALAVLYSVNRSIQRELAPATESQAETPIREAQTETIVPSGAAAEITTAQDRSLTYPDADPVAASVPDAAENDTRPARTELQDLPGVAGMLARLSKAIETQDNALIKQCMDELVTLGDDALGPLGEVIANGSDTAALWAAKALAQIGTPVASSLLLDALSQVEDGWYKEQLVKESSNIGNHDSWPILLDALQSTVDPSVLRAAGTSLAKMADKPVVDEIVARYDAATTEEEASRMAQMLGTISSPAASESLLALAGSVSSVPQDGLERAAIDALANIGDTQCVSYLLRKLEASPPGEGGYLFNTITSISQPQAEAALQYAAAGSKDVSAEQGRTAAICALVNFPSERTYGLLEQIVATADNASIMSAAARTLESIRNAEPVVAASAGTKIPELLLLPSDPLQK